MGGVQRTAVALMAVNGGYHAVRFMPMGPVFALLGPGAPGAEGLS
jgi:hypothetical protein